MISKEKVLGLIIGFTLVVGLFYKANQFFTAPEIDIFEVPTVKLDGTNYKISDIDGKNLIVNIWATWCAPCIKEMPYLATVQEKLNQEHWQVILISDEELEKIESFRQKHNVKLEMLKAQESLKDYGVKGYPTTYVIDQNGNIVFNRNGDLKLFKTEFENSLVNLDLNFSN